MVIVENMMESNHSSSKAIFLRINLGDNVDLQRNHLEPHSASVFFGMYNV